MSHEELAHPDLAEEEHDHEDHPLPKGALVMTLAYLLLLTMLWMQVYLQLLNNGGIQRP